MASTNNVKKTTPVTTKLPKGEFPSNIHILKGPANPDNSNSRSINSKAKPGKLFADMTLETLPKFKDVPSSHRIELFKAKLKAC